MQLRHRVELQVFPSAVPGFDADIAVYQIGNNGYHDLPMRRHCGIPVWSFYTNRTCIT